jgi:TRAP-type C4-dicarboxylate transport system substrate-binding protein
MIEKQSGGRVKFRFFWDQSLVKASDTWKAIQTGIIDIGYYVLGFVEDPELHALNGFTGLPFMGWKDMKMATDIYHQVFPKFPELNAEFGSAKLLWICTMPPNQLHSVNKEVRVPADFKGVRVMTSSRLVQIAASAGATPITSIAPPDWKMSLERGLAESIMVHWPAIIGYNLIPLFQYHTDFGDAGISMSMHGMWANEAVWNKLPDDIQRIILDNSPWIEDKYISIDEAEIIKAVNEAKVLGHTFAILNQNEIEEWKKIAESVTNKWIKNVEDMGLPAQAVYDEVKRLIREYKKQ